VHLSNVGRNKSAQFRHGSEKPGNTSPPSSESCSTSSTLSCGEENIAIVWAFGSTIQTNRTPAAKYSRRLRAISAGVFDRLTIVDADHCRRSTSKVEISAFADRRAARLYAAKLVHRCDEHAGVEMEPWGLQRPQGRIAKALIGTLRKPLVTGIVTRRVSEELGQKTSPSSLTRRVTRAKFRSRPFAKGTSRDSTSRPAILRSLLPWRGVPDVRLLLPNAQVSPRRGGVASIGLVKAGSDVFRRRHSARFMAEILLRNRVLFVV
jgi:hypothetical protein